jgi:PAS domain S-box-containing protein
MKIRVIILIFAALAFFTSAVGGSLYYYAIKKSAAAELHKESADALNDMAGRISLYLANYQKITATMAGLKEMRQGLAIKKGNAGKEADAILTHFQKNLGVDVCYLIDRSGTTIASSNHNTPESFVGKKYAFRPYFISAMAGTPAVYMALGVVTAKRGVYYSHAIYDEDHSAMIGVVVLKASVDDLEHELKKQLDGVAILTNEQGVIFASNREDWLLRTLWKEDPETLSAIASTQQFGSSALQWTGLEKIDGGLARDAAGNRFMVHEASIENYPGWKVLFLHDQDIVSNRISGMMVRETGFVILLICFSIGAVSIVLYRKANSEIVKRKKAEEELKNINTTLQAVIKASPLPIVGVDTAGSTVLWNPAAERVFGWTEQEVLGRQPLIVPPDLQQEHISFRNRIIDDDTITGVETRRMKKDGTLIDVTVSSATIHDEQGLSVAAMGIYEEITDRKKAEDEVRFLAAIIQDLPDAVCAIDTAGRVVTWNRGAGRMLGYSADEVIGKPITTVIPEDIAQEEFSHCLTILNTEGFFSGYESVRLTKDGRRVPVELTAVAIRDGSQAITHYASIMIDLTDRKKAEEERLKLHMLESIGFLAAGIAHDFNNLLSVILGNIHIAKMSLPSDEKAFSRLSDAENVIDLASELSRRLVTFATGGEPRRTLTSLSVLFTDTVTALLKGSAIQAVLDLPEDLAEVSIDEGQMKQVISNLVINAKEAMPAGGTLTVRGKNIKVSAQDNFPLRDGRYLHLSISDTGSGIAEENLARIFDPYFSTKNTYSQKGLGLGLAVCYSIIKKHDGLLTVESAVGKGATYHIYLPVTA